MAKMFGLNPQYYKEKNSHFLFFNFPWGDSGSIYWEFGPPVWWLPRIEKHKRSKAFRIGWLLFAFGMGYRSYQDRINTLKKLGLMPKEDL